jgi:hypothetical protein
MNVLIPSEQDLVDLRSYIEQCLRMGFYTTPQVIRFATEQIFLNSPNTKAGTFEQWEELVIPLTQEAIASYKEEEETWDGPTDNDRLNWVFDYLEKTGIAAQQNFWCCQTCANAGINTIMKNAPSQRPYFGFVYFHEQDTEYAVKDGMLTIAFGANPELGEQAWIDYKTRQESYARKANKKRVPFYDVNVEIIRDDNLQFIPLESRDLMARRVGARFMNTAILAGLDAVWDGSADRKIKLPFQWRQRRSTASQFVPEYFEDESTDHLYRGLGVEDDPEQFLSCDPPDDR